MKHWLVTSKVLAAQIDDFFERRSKCVKKMQSFCRKYGGKKARLLTSNSVFSVCFAIYTDAEMDKSIWKRTSLDLGWVPRASSKAAKAIKTEMDAIAREMPTTSELAKILSVSVFDGRHLTGPGVRIVAGKIYVSTQQNFPGAKGLKRISDLAFERATAME